MFHRLWLLPLFGVLPLLFWPEADSGNRDLPVVRIQATRYPERVEFLGAHLGDGVILTCGHCCRAAGGVGRPVELLILSAETGQPYRRQSATITCYDPSADIGVIRCPPNSLDAAYQLAPAQTANRPGDQVRVFRWDGRRELLTSHAERIASVNRYEGRANFETTGVPRSGESGGPLLDGETNYIIGVTVAADPPNGRGIYTAHPAIWPILERCAE